MSSNTMIIELSVTESDLRTFLRAWNRTGIYGLPAQIQTEPTVALDGVNYRVRTPRINPDRAAIMLQQFDAQRVNTGAMTLSLPVQS